MDNAIRAALDAWLPLVKGLSFDERVGFITMVIAYNKTIKAEKDGPLTPHPMIAFEALFTNYRNEVYATLIQLQSEQLKALDTRRELPTPSAQAKTQTVKVVKPHATREQLIAAIDKAVKRVGYGDKNAAKDIQRYARQLERISR